LGDKGAESLSGTQEWHYNKKVAEYLRLELKKRNINSVVFSSYQGASYAPAMAWLATQLNVFNVDFAVELHFNSSDNPLSSGYEFLYWHKSRASLKIAKLFQQVFNKKFPQNKDRGVKGLTPKDRGALFTLLTSMPAIILEPFFGSNRDEWNFFGKSHEGIQSLVDAYADAIELCVVSI
jgi:N-acetylmuramoyl-L-alanine amidase